MSGSSRFVFKNVNADSDSAGPTAPTLGATDDGAGWSGKPARLP